MEQSHDVVTDVGFGATVAGSGGLSLHGGAPRSLYTMECWKPDGTLRWREELGNVVTVSGRTMLLAKFFSTDAAYTPVWYVGIISSTHAPTSSDLMPSTQRDWSESTCYSNGARRTLTLYAPTTALVSSSSNPAVYTINQTTEVFGAFLTNSSQISTGSTYTLYGAANFTTPSSSGRSVVTGDTLNVPVTLTASTS